MVKLTVRPYIRLDDKQQATGGGTRLRFLSAGGKGGGASAVGGDAAG